MTFIVVHYPKAGGNSLQVALQRRFGDQLTLDYADDPALPDGQRQRDPSGYFARQDPIPTECVFGHFHPGKYRHVEAARFTTLREPIDNLISIYFYWRSAAPGGLLHRKFLGENLDIIGLAKMPELRWLMSRTYFEDVDMNTFDFIGRHNAREATNRRLGELMGLEPFDDVHENKTPESDERQRLNQDASMMGALAELLEDDIAFYRRHAFRDIA